MDESSIEETVAHRLREARLAVPLTQAELAYECEFHPTRISQWEKLDRTPNIANLVKLADELDVDLDWLTGRK